MNFICAKIGGVVGLLAGFMHPSNDFSGVGALGFAIVWGVFFGVVGLVLDFVFRAVNKTPSPESHVKCPDCRELVLRDAKKCKHCGCNLIPQ